MLINRIKLLFWIYFWLLLLEGALRKWLIPELSTPLLIIRDPVVLLMYWYAYKGRVFPDSSFIKILFLIGYLFVLWGILAIIQNDSSNLIVVIFGLRTNILHFPFIFLIPKVLSRKDLYNIGKVLLAIALPMAVLMTFQFLSPSGAFINRGAGGAIEAQLPAGLGRIRPPGTFTFVSGPVGLFPLIAAFVCNAFLEEKQYSPLLLIFSTLGCILACVVSGSRALIVNMSIVFLAFFFLALIWYRAKLGIKNFWIPVSIATISLPFLGVVEEGIEVISSRFIRASAGPEGQAGGLIMRIIRSFTNPLTNTDAPFLDMD
ncbi:MAG: hypothetical protein HC921_20350 [Synechococcaceae cyanobacterium SM2_3_1]|nr:hypothetical protein [Synechococcaceae cyanobacterium SM2_3_1]